MLATKIYLIQDLIFLSPILFLPVCYVDPLHRSLAGLFQRVWLSRRELCLTPTSSVLQPWRTRYLATKLGDSPYDLVDLTALSFLTANS